MKQLTEMAKPFPKRFLGKDDRGNEAVDHTVVTQRLLQIVGPYDMHIAEILRSEVSGMKTKSGKEYAGGLFVTGAIVRLTLTIDGRKVEVEETGGCENAAMKDGDGERMKHAISDAIKRCGMRLGLGLHMWAQENFFLYEALVKESSEAGSDQPSEPKAESADPKGSPSVSTPQPSPEEVKDASRGEVSAAPEASSGDIFGTIATAMADKKLMSKVLTTANRFALVAGKIPEGGINRQTILELPEEILKQVATELNLNQEALV